MASAFEEGLLVGLLVGEGHFGGDGRQPQVTLRMHARHEAMFRWLERTFPGGRLYGPYEHGGRRYFQWMVRGPYLRDVVFPLLEQHVTTTLDRYACERLATMATRYARQLGRFDTPDLDTPDLDTTSEQLVEQAVGPDMPASAVERAAAASGPDARPSDGTSGASPPSPEAAPRSSARARPTVTGIFAALRQQTAPG
ncbi:MAG: hypothetical protein ACRDWE_07790 [Acidimicrobiales bacterium]